MINCQPPMILVTSTGLVSEVDIAIVDQNHISAGVANENVGVALHVKVRVLLPFFIELLTIPDLVTRLRT